MEICTLCGDSLLKTGNLINVVTRGIPALLNASEERGDNVQHALAEQPRMAGVAPGPPWLEGLETPYLWSASELLLPGERTSLLHRLQDRETRNDTHLTFDNFVISLVLGCELFTTAEDAEAATTALEVLEIELFTMDIISNCSFYREVRRAHWHTLLASRAVLLARTGKLAESRKVVEENFDPVTVFNLIEKAAVFGIKSRAFLEYGPKAWPEALRLAKEAIQINVNEAEWHFIAGKALENIRLSKGPVTGIPEEEIQHFEMALALGKRKHHAVYLENVCNLLSKQFKDLNIYDEKIDNLITNLTRRSFELL